MVWNVNNRVSIIVSGDGLILLAALLLLLPFQWVGAVILSITVHELCHAITIVLLGGTIQRIDIDMHGVTMKHDGISGIKESICALSGPVGSLLLLLLFPWLPRTAICGFMHGIFNLIPLFPMDGGRILYGLLYSTLRPPLAKKIFLMSQQVISVIVFLLAGITAIKFGAGFLIILILCLSKMHLPRSLFRSTIDTLSTKRYGHDRITKKDPSQCAKTGTIHRRRI
jgi:Zn-dependent protease